MGPWCRLGQSRQLKSSIGSSHEYQQSPVSPGLVETKDARTTRSSVANSQVGADLWKQFGHEMFHGRVGFPHTVKGSAEVVYRVVSG